MKWWFNIHKSINMIHHISKRKDKNHISNHLDRCRETFWQNSTSIYDLKTLNKVGINIIKDMTNPQLKSGTREGWPLRPLLFNTVLEVLATAIRQEKNKKQMTWKRRSKIVTICRWHNSIYRNSERLYQKSYYYK